MEPREVAFTLSITGLTDRDPWEWAEGVKGFLADELNRERMEDTEEITVSIVDAEEI
jgi:hypothetical protein